MNRNKIRVVLGTLAFTSLAVLNFTQSERSFMNGSLASSDESSSEETSSTSTSTETSTTTTASTSSTAVDHTKGTGLANKHCPIWTISYTFNTSLIPSSSVSCTTGGEYKCEAGVCPHGV